MSTRFFAFILASGLAAGGWSSPVRLVAGTFEPGVSSLSIPVGLKGSDHEGGLIIVQADGTLNQTLQLRLKDAGFEVLEYLPENSWLVRGKASEAMKVEGVTSATVFAPFFKLDPSIGTRAFKSEQRIVERNQGLVRVAIYATRDSSPEIVRAEFDAVPGVSILHSNWNGTQYVFIATVPQTRVSSLASYDSVQFIHEASELVDRNNTVRWLMQSNTLNSTPVYAAGLTGTGEIFGILDGKVDVNHSSFSDTNPIGPSHRKIVYYGGTLGLNTHGTHVAGILAGDAGVFDDRRGTAYQGKFACSIEPAYVEADIYNVFLTHAGVGARIHTNSWGDDSTNIYTGMCRGIDSFVYDNEDNLVLFAITNLLNVLKIPENAKNQLAVGAVRDYPDQDSFSSFSGLGPTADGRTKPEIVAPGAVITSSQAGSTNGVINLSGTSMATPAVAAALGLARQYLREGRHSDGLPNANFGFVPSGALLRAIAVTGGQDITSVSGWPSTREGFGRLILDNALSFNGETRKLIVKDVRRVNGPSQGQTQSFKFKVVTAGQPLRIAMAFTDYPAAVSAASAPVNDANLTVKLGSFDYFGNVLSGGSSVTGGTPDSINSVEVVNWVSGPAGIYEVKVSAPTVNVGSKIGYGVAVTGNVIRSEITGSLGSPGFLGLWPTTVSVQFLNSSSVPIAGAVANASVNPTTGEFTLVAPVNVDPPYRFAVNFGTFLRKVFPSPSASALTDLFTSTGVVSLVNGDINDDGEVGSTDFDIVVANYGLSPATPSQGDINDDDEVGSADFDLIVANFGLADN